ncbi:hypothetical protein DOY81_005042, partial [Sarcophaga bullata]
RESSAQTLPYLPGVSNDPVVLETIEVFKLPTILPGDKPPGLYEVEVLERARKRWAFAKALKENFRKQIEKAREKLKLDKHHHILEAFEWEHWIEREEYIQECQMMRLEILIRMFDKREREMHTASQKRIQMSCEVIEAKRVAALKKNEIEYHRALRRLEMAQTKQSRVWRKEHISQGLGNPNSEFYAPKMRYGVNPSRRHYNALHKGFDMRMDDLEKRAVKMDFKHLKCPFAKLKEWSKPKEVLQEVEQNFCSDENLKRLYESLRTLRESSRKQRYAPLCLKEKDITTGSAEDQKIEEESRLPTLHFQSSSDEEVGSDSSSIRRSEEAREEFSLEELARQKQAEREELIRLQNEMQREELETLIISYEGNAVGWLMRFLTEEMIRVKEQRKLHLYTMIIKLERWRREAAEAGLRQKENCMRQTYEKLYEECDQMNQEPAAEFLKEILDSDIKDYAEQEAQEYVTILARELDKEISSWLDTFRQVQNPLNYENLRYALRDIVMPDIEQILYRVERDKIIDFIINKVILCRVFKGLEAYDVSFSFVSDLVDRIIDNDIYLDSPDCSSDCDCGDFCFCTRAKMEAMAIIRKAIRHSVPGRRWLTPNERVAFENLRDVLDDVFDSVIPKGNIIEVDMPEAPEVPAHDAHTNLVCREHDIVLKNLFEAPSKKKEVELRCITTTPALAHGDITKSLEDAERLLLPDPDKLSIDKTLMGMDEYVEPEAIEEPQEVHVVPSTHDISTVFMDFKKMPVFAQTSSEELLQRLLAEEEEQEYEEEEIRVEEKTEETEEEEEEKGQEIIEVETEAPSSEFTEAIEEIYSQKESVPDEVKPPEKPKKKEPQKEEEKEVRFGKPTSIEFPSSIDQEEQDEGGFMEVAFVYDPELAYSVPVPSGYDITEDEKKLSVHYSSHHLIALDDTTDSTTGEGDVSYSYEQGGKTEKKETTEPK